MGFTIYGVLQSVWHNLERNQVASGLQRPLFRYATSRMLCFHEPRLSEGKERKMTNSEGNSLGFAKRCLLLGTSLEIRYDKRRSSITKRISRFRNLRVQRNRVSADGIALARGLRRYGVLSVLWKGHRQRGSRTPIRNRPYREPRLNFRIILGTAPCGTPSPAAGRESDFTGVGQRRSLRTCEQSASGSQNVPWLMAFVGALLGLLTKFGSRFCVSVKSN